MLGLDEHPGRSAGWVVYRAMVGFDDFHHQFDHRGRREKLAAFLAFAQGEFAQEELVDFAENVAIGIRRDVGEVLKQFRQQGIAGAGKSEVFVLGQDAIQLGFVFLDGFHGLFDFSGQVFLLRQAQKVVVTGMVRKIETAFLNGDVGDGFFPPGAPEFCELFGDVRLGTLVLVVGEFQEDQAEYRRGVFAGLEIGVGPKVIGGRPEVVFKLFELFGIHGGKTSPETATTQNVERL